MSHFKQNLAGIRTLCLPLLTIVISASLLWSCGNKAASALIPSENYKEEITHLTTSYYDMLGEENFEKALSYLHPMVFEQTPKEKLLEMFEQSAQWEMMSTINTSFDINNISDYITEKDATYVRIDYTTGSMMKVSQDMPEKDYQILLQVLPNRLGEDNLRPGPEERTFLYSTRGSMVAILEKGETSWKLVEVNPMQKDALASYFPDGLFSKLGF